MSSLINEAIVEASSGTASAWTSADTVLNQGEWGYETDTGKAKIGDGSTAWTSLSYVTNSVETFDISSGNQTMTLPVVTGYPQSYDYFWNGGDGTYTATLAVTSSETVGGIAAATWTGEGSGSISVVSDGTNWQVKNYIDSGVDTTSEVTSDMYWEKSKNGKLSQHGVERSTDAGTNTTEVMATLTLPITFIADPEYRATPIRTNGVVSDCFCAGYSGFPTTTATRTIAYYGNGGSFSNEYLEIAWECVGRWRT